MIIQTFCGCYGFSLHNNVTNIRATYIFNILNNIISHCDHGCPQEIFQRGAKPRGLTKITYFFGAPKARTKIFAIFFFRRFRLNLKVFDASAEGASENFRAFFTGNHMTSSFSNSKGGNCPKLPHPSGRL